MGGFKRAKVSGTGKQKEKIETSGGIGNLPKKIAFQLPCQKCFLLSIAWVKCDLATLLFIKGLRMREINEVARSQISRA